MLRAVGCGPFYRFADREHDGFAAVADAFYRSGRRCRLRTRFYHLRTALPFTRSAVLLPAHHTRVLHYHVTVLPLRFSSAADHTRTVLPVGLPTGLPPVLRLRYPAAVCRITFLPVAAYDIYRMMPAVARRPTPARTVAGSYADYLFATHRIPPTPPAFTVRCLGSLPRFAHARRDILVTGYLVLTALVGCITWIFARTRTLRHLHRLPLHGYAAAYRTRIRTCRLGSCAFYAGCSFWFVTLDYLAHGFWFCPFALRATYAFTVLVYGYLRFTVCILLLFTFCTFPGCSLLPRFCLHLPRSAVYIYTRDIRLPVYYLSHVYTRTAVIWLFAALRYGSALPHTCRVTLYYAHTAHVPVAFGCSSTLPAGWFPHTVGWTTRIY